MPMAVRAVPKGRALVIERPFVISKTEVIIGDMYGETGGITSKMPRLIIENNIRYPQSLIKIKKLSIIQTSIS